MIGRPTASRKASTLSAGGAFTFTAILRLPMIGMGRSMALARPSAVWRSAAPMKAKAEKMLRADGLRLFQFVSDFVVMRALASVAGMPARLRPSSMLGQISPSAKTAASGFQWRRKRATAPGPSTGAIW